MKKLKHIEAGKNAVCGSGYCCLRVDNLSVAFGGETILSNVSFHMHCGELIALIGPNGAGKSSLFKSILGQMPHSGTISFHTARGSKLKPRIGYVPQSPSFDPGDPLSVLDLFVCSISNHPVWLPIPKGLREQVLTCLERVHGEDLIDKRVGSLSGGELQRVLLAMALEPLPNLLILDEPMSGVDMEGEQQLFDLLDDIRTRYDLSILISTHDFNTLHLMDKVILLKQQILKVGTPHEVTESEEFKQLFTVTAKKGEDE
jgi:zinc transport system ATP-binding protein